MKLQVLCPESSLWCVQRLYLPQEFHGSLTGKYAFVNLTTGRYVCRIYIKKSLSPYYCILSKAVKVEECYSDKQDFNESLAVDRIEVIPRVNYIKKLSISVVFIEPEDTEKWGTNMDGLSVFLKDILKMYILVNQSVVFLDKLNIPQKLRIFCIQVNSIGNIAAGKVVGNTDIQIKTVLSSQRYKQKIEQKLPDISGLTEPYENLKQTLSCQNEFTSLSDKVAISTQILLIGPGGCGKKTLVRRVAHDCGFVLHTIDASEISKPKPGDSEALLRNGFRKAILLSQEAGNEGKCVLLLRHLETICRKSGRIMWELLRLLDSVVECPRLAVIATIDQPHLLHEAVRSTSRLHTEVYINVPNEAERTDMLMNIFKEVSLSKESCLEISKVTPGFVIADLVLLGNTVFRKMYSKTCSSSSLREMDILKLAKISVGMVEASCLRAELGTIPTLSCDINQLGGLEAVKLSLQQAVLWPLIHAEAFTRLSIHQPSGVLLYGPPGCAKTSLVRAIASSHKTNFLSVSAADLYSSYLGDTERKITQLFQRARTAAPTILFIDEIDALVGNREGKMKGAQERVLSSFLTEMDGVGIKLNLEPTMAQKKETGVIVIAATNRPNALDSALIRPGRLDHLIYVPPPSVQDRLDILQKLTARMPIGKCVDLKIISENTELFSGADLCNLCREAALVALKVEDMSVAEIKLEHWMKALNELSPSLTKSQVEWYENFSFT